MARVTIPGEAEIVWTENVSCLPYVRELIVETSSRTRSLRKLAPGRCLGWSVLARDTKPSVRGGLWLRRVFWLRPGEASDYSNGSRPAEGVAPGDVELGVAEHGVGYL